MEKIQTNIERHRKRMRELLIESERVSSMPKRNVNGFVNRDRTKALQRVKRNIRICLQAIDYYNGLEEACGETIQKATARATAKAIQNLTK